MRAHAYVRTCIESLWEGNIVGEYVLYVWTCSHNMRYLIMQKYTCKKMWCSHTYVRTHVPLMCIHTHMHNTHIMYAHIYTHTIDTYVHTHIIHSHKHKGKLNPNCVELRGFRMTSIHKPSHTKCSKQELCLLAEALANTWSLQ